MSFKKYVEIEWKEVRLKPFKDWGETKFYLNIAADCPTVYVPKNINEKLISDLDQQQLGDTSWIIKPKKFADRMLFSGHVENFLQIAVSILESDEQTLINSVSEGLGKLGDTAGKLGNSLVGKLFPFLGISSLAFSGIASLIKDRDDFLGAFIYQLRRDTFFPIGRPVVGTIQKGNETVGEVDILIYIQPEDVDSSSIFYRDVEIFPFSMDEIAVYYSGDLMDSKEVYMIWTMDNWKSNPLTKMKRVGKYWIAIIKIPSNIEEGMQLEVAFTDGQEKWDKKWDNNDGDNWVFQHFRWI